MTCSIEWIPQAWSSDPPSGGILCLGRSWLRDRVETDVSMLKGSLQYGVRWNVYIAYILCWILHGCESRQRKSSRRLEWLEEGNPILNKPVSTVAGGMMAGHCSGVVAEPVAPVASAPLDPAPSANGRPPSRSKRHGAPTTSSSVDKLGSSDTRWK